jgi:hypothetical protein
VQRRCHVQAARVVVRLHVGVLRRLVLVGLECRINGGQVVEVWVFALTGKRREKKVNLQDKILGPKISPFPIL